MTTEIKACPRCHQVPTPKVWGIDNGSSTAIVLTCSAECTMESAVGYDAESAAREWNSFVDEASAELTAKRDDSERQAAPQKRTEQELFALKQSWLLDPCYDLEDAEGFEAHREELLAFRLQQEAMNAASYKRRLEHRAAELGIPGQIELAEIIVSLETRIAELTARVDGLDATAADQDRMRVASYR